jgi:HEAT repeat protein
LDRLEWLVELGPEGLNELQRVLNQLEHGASYTEWLNALHAFRQMGPVAAPAVPFLTRALSANLELRTSAAEALAHTEPQNTNLLPVLTLWLKDGGSYSRGKAAGLIGELGTRGKAAVPALKPLLQDPNPRVRTAAEVALKKIDAAGN